MKKDLSKYTKQELIQQIQEMSERLRILEYADTSFRPDVKVEIDSNSFGSDNAIVGEILHKIDEFVYFVRINIDGTRTIRYLSPNLSEKLGVTEKEFEENLKVINNCHPDDLKNIFETAAKLRTQKTPQVLEYRYFHPVKKEYIWLEEKIYPQFDKEGRYSANLGIIRDLTDKKNLKEEVLRQENKFRLFVENASDVIFRIILQPEYRYEYISPSVEQLTGYKPEEFYSNPMLSVTTMYPESQVKMQKYFADVLSKKKSETEGLSTIITRVKHKNGKDIWIETRNRLFFSEDDIVIAIEGISRDITVQKQIEHELNTQKESYQSLIEQYPDGIVIADTDKKIMYLNDQVLKISGYDTKEEILGKNVFEFLSSKQTVKSQERISNLLNGIPVPFEIIDLKRKDGSIIQIESRPGLFKYQGSCAMLIFLRDITAERLLEKEQLRAQLAEETTKKLQQEIDERKKAEQELKATQKNLRLLFESSLDMICASDPDGYITEFNQAAQSKFGYTKEEVIGKHISFLYNKPEDRDHVMSELVRGSGIYSGEIVNKKKNGQVFTCYLSASVLKDEHGNVLGSMGVSRDISEIKQREQELRNSEEKYRAIYNQAYIGIALVDKDTGMFMEANQRLQEMLGYTKEELLEKTVDDLHLPGDLSRLPKGGEFIRRGFERIVDEHRYRKKDGSEVIVNITITLVKGVNNDPQYFVYVYEDITPQRKAEEQIRLQSAKLNAIFESSSHMIWTIDREFRLTSFNHRQAEWLKERYNVTAHIGMSMISGRMISSDDYNSFWIQKINSSFEGKPQVFEVEFSDRNGRKLWREIFMNPIYGPNNTVVEISNIAHDITEKKTADEKLKQSLKEKEVLLKEVHHRVKNNLQVISSILNLQSSYIKDKKILEILLESQNRIKSMAFVHESLYQTKDFSSIGFSEYVSNISRNLVHSYALQQIPELKLDLDPVMLNLDTAIPCGLIINELVSNAMKYAFSDGRKGNIMVAVKKDHETITMIVSDDGKGLPDHINYRNTESLGLQLVVTLVEQINGTIELDKKKGTKFTIEFTNTPVNS